MRWRRVSVLLSMFVVAGLLGGCTGSAAPTATAVTQAVPATAAAPAGKVAPELVGELQWFNSSPMTLADLRGKAVLLVFWSDI